MAPRPGSLGGLSQRKLNALGLPIAYVDRNQRYRFVNKAFLDWLGLEPDDVVGREIIEVVGRDVYPLYRAYIDAALAGERTGFERQLVAPGRPPLWIRVDYYPDRKPQGHVRGFLVTYSDVDHLKRLELEAGQREHRLRLVTDSVGAADPLLRPAAEAPLRQQAVRRAGSACRPTTCSATRCSDVLPADAFAEMQGYIERAFAGATGVVRAARAQRRRASSRWVRITLFPDREVGGRVGGAFVGDDRHRGRRPRSATR